MTINYQKGLLGNIGVTVIPSQVAINSGFQAFDSHGELVDEKQARMLQTTIEELHRTAECLK